MMAAAPTEQKPASRPHSRNKEAIVTPSETVHYSSSSADLRRLRDMRRMVNDLPIVLPI